MRRAPREYVLLVVWIVCPEPDQAAEALEDRRDDSIVRECAPGFLAVGLALSLGPGVQLTELGGEAGLELTPALHSTWTVGRPGVVVDADQPADGQERLTGDPDTNHIRSHRPGLQPLPPSPKMLPEVAVETASSPGVRGKGRQRGRWIWAREVDAVVAEEDPTAVCRVGVADEVCTSGRSDLHTPAFAGIPCREALPENGRLREIDRQQVDIRRPGTYGASSDRSVDVQRCPGVAKKGDRISQDGSKAAGTRPRCAPVRIVPSAATPSSGSAIASTHARAV